MLNKKGLNLMNGALMPVYSNDNKFEGVELVEHAEEHYFSYKTSYEYKPEIGTAKAEELLSQIIPDNDLRRVFIDTIATRLDPSRAMTSMSRVRALLMIGSGQNGKDFLRVLSTEAIGYNQVSNLSFNAFAAVDRGDRGLIDLSTSTLNWSSENSKCVFNESSSLKASISGDPLPLKQLYKDRPITIKPRAVFVFSMNELPMITSSQEASLSRFAIIELPHTFKDKPSKNNPLEFKANPKLMTKEYLSEEILPSFLNLIIERFESVTKHGIDYSMCDVTSKEISRNFNYLDAYGHGRFEACNHHDGLSTRELMNDYKAWCVNEGYLPDFDSRSHDLIDTPRKLVNELRRSLFIKSSESMNCNGTRRYPFRIKLTELQK